MYFDEVTAKLEEVRLSGTGVAVVHCMVGVSRSASFVLGMLIITSCTLIRLSLFCPLRSLPDSLPSHVSRAGVPFCEAKAFSDKP